MSAGKGLFVGVILIQAVEAKMLIIFYKKFIGVQMYVYVHGGVVTASVHNSYRI